MTPDIRNARFYVVDEELGAPGDSAQPLEFNDAFCKAVALADSGARIKVLYTEEASQTEITRFVSKGIATALVSGA